MSVLLFVCLFVSLVCLSCLFVCLSCLFLVCLLCFSILFLYLVSMSLVRLECVKNIKDVEEAIYFVHSTYSNPVCKYPYIAVQT